MHLGDEILRAYLDRQLEDAEQAADHLNSCAECRVRFAAIQARAERVGSHLARLDPGPAETPRSAQLTFAQFTARQAAAEKEKGSMLKVAFSRWRPVWIGAGMILLLAFAFSFPSVRAFAGDLLARFRVQKITVVQIDNTRLSELSGNAVLAKQIGQLVSDSIDISKEPGKPRVAANAAQATQWAGFKVRLASSRSDTPEISVQDGAAFEFVVNRARAQMLLNEAGASTIQLPASLDGAKIQVNIPTGVSIAYGNCPKVGESDREKGAPRRIYKDCLMLVEIPSPVVDTPSNLDVQQLAELGLQFSGMKPEQAREFSRQVDWTSTLVIPIPRGGASYKPVQVDGVSGYLIQRFGDEEPECFVVWIKDGIIHAVGGLVGDATAALAIANSLK